LYLPCMLLVSPHQLHIRSPRSPGDENKL
jgi:hypothetical protein